MKEAREAEEEDRLRKLSEPTASSLAKRRAGTRRKACAKK